MTTEISVHSSKLLCEDGLSMAVDVYAPTHATVALPTAILCHGFKGFRKWGMFPRLAERLARTGRSMVLFDFSHNGTETDPEQFTRLDLFEQQTVTRHVQDLGRVLEAMEAGELTGAETVVDPTNVFVVGHSMGGGVGLMRAASDRRLSGLACLNAVSHFNRVPEEGLAELEQAGRVSIPNTRTGQVMHLGRAWFDDIAEIDLQAIAEEVPVPTLVLQGDADTNVSPAEGEALADWIPGNVLFSVPGGDHTFGAKHPWAGWTPSLEMVNEQLDAFLPCDEV